MKQNPLKKTNSARGPLDKRRSPNVTPGSNKVQVREINLPWVNYMGQAKAAHPKRPSSRNPPSGPSTHGHLNTSRSRAEK